MICTKGEKYDTDTLRFVGWTKGDGSSTDGYSAWAYFDATGVYLGADEFGIEPEFDVVGRTYRLVSAKGNRSITGTQAEAVEAAIKMDIELQPAYGVTIEDASGNTVAEVSDGEVSEGSAWSE